ncbi:nose resistant to fluoxetine protein 6-like [Littorina saxatilis]|uniref:Acyltransferase 3 domain-containing protein n=1 Tax=Littorina saxatilis TaxID=31220 RepID=A0AAN9AL21_9CAEN
MADMNYSSTNDHTSSDEHVPLLVKPEVMLKPPEIGTCTKVFLAFSVYTNGAKLLSTSQPAGSLSCVHGVRFLSMTWVVLGHSFAFPLISAANLYPYAQEMLPRWTFQGIVNASISVDSFFVLSGLLVAYLSLKEMKKKGGKINWFLFYFHRFWR